MELEMLVSDRECRLPSLNSVICPSNAPEAVIRKSLLEDYHIEIGGGLGELAGKIWRIGLMGLNSNQNNIILFVSALEQALKRNGFPVKTGQGISAVLD